MNPHLAQQLRAQNAKRTAIDILRDLSEASRKMDGILSDLRAFAPIEAARFMAALSATDADDLEDTLFAVRNKAASVSDQLAIELDVEGPALDREVEADIDARTLAELPDRPKLMAAE